MSTAFDLPRERMLRVEAAELAVSDEPHPYEAIHAPAVDDYWRRRTAENPALFDGRILLFSRLVWRDGLLTGLCHRSRFATFLHWRDREPDGTVEHVFGHAMPVTADDALVAVRMHGSTANAGRVYFAAGSYEPEDISDGRVDVRANMLREVGEETGIDLSPLDIDSTLHAWSSNGRTTLVRRFRLDQSAEALCRKVANHVAAETDPEIVEAVVLRREGPAPEGLAPHMPPLLRWHFGTPATWVRP